MTDDDRNRPHAPNLSRPDKGEPWGLLMLNRPLYLSFWILMALAEVGAVWLFWQVLPGYPALLNGTIVTVLAGGVLKESFVKNVPHRF